MTNPLKSITSEAKLSYCRQVRVYSIILTLAICVMAMVASYDNPVRYLDW